MLKIQYHATPQILRSDNGGEFINSVIRTFLSDHGMVHQTSFPDTPQQNGVAKRKNRTLLEITRSLLIESRSPSYLWPKAIATAAYLTNHLPSKPLNYETPLETLGSFVSLPSFHSYLLVSLGVLSLFIFQNNPELNLRHGLYSVSL